MRQSDIRANGACVRNVEVLKKFNVTFSGVKCFMRYAYLRKVQRFSSAMPSHFNERKIVKANKFLILWTPFCKVTSKLRLVLKHLIWKRSHRCIIVRSSRISLVDKAKTESLNKCIQFRRFFIILQNGINVINVVINVIINM